ncbi:MAG: hypothetical protein KTR22_14255 [Flavobacteriaceae bacterium]|nr:hypothetical protein [Flavobacteriaceae bacterium]
MKTTCSQKIYGNLLLFFTFLSSATLLAQVGINTTTPGSGSMLDVTSTEKGMLVPRVDIADLSTIAPITGGSTESLLVYNTNTTTGRGFYFWNGSIWVGIDGDGDWKLDGNTGTTPGTGANENFIGTTDSQDVVLASNATEVARMKTSGQIAATNDGSAGSPSYSFNNDLDTGLYLSGTNQITLSNAGTDQVTFTSDGRIRAHTAGTLENPLFAWSADSNKGFYSPGADMFGLVTNGAERFRIPNADQVYAMANGSNGAPFYSWSADSNTGMWRSGGDRLNLSAGGREFIEMYENNANSELTINDASNEIDFRIETDDDANFFFIDAASDELGIKTNDPQNDIHIAGTGTGIRVDAFNTTNNLNNNGVDVTPVYVDSNGDLTLQAPLVLNNMPEDNLTTFVSTATAVDAIGGGPLVASTLYTTTITLTQDALVEVVYQLGVNIENYLGGTITDGAPRQYGTALFIDSNLVGYTSEAYANSQTSGTICNGTFFLNGNGYAQLTGVAAGTTYNVSVVGFVYGADYGVRGIFGGTSGADRFQLIVHH